MSCGAGGDRQIELLHAEVQNRSRDHQPRQRPGDADIENLFAIGPHAVHADHRAHRADQAERHGNAERVAGRNAVAHRLQEVAHLVRQQDREHGAHVRQPLLPIVRQSLARYRPSIRSTAAANWPRRPKTSTGTWRRTA